MKKTDLSGKKILLLGFGQEGRATYKFLCDNILYFQLGIADKKEWKKLDEVGQGMLSHGADYRLHFGASYLDHVAEYDVIIKTPGIPFLPQIIEAQEQGVIVTSATELFFAEAKGEIIGVTGSKGKSTTCSLLFDVFRQAGKNVELIGNIGKPALEYLQQDSSEKLSIFELSSYQLENTCLTPRVGLITSFFPAHLDHHPDLEQYRQSKLNLFRCMTVENVAVYSSKYSTIAQEIAKINCTKIVFNNSDSSTIRDGYLWDQGEKIMKISEVPLKGQHNLENILGVIAVARVYDISREDIVSAIRNFTPLAHRLEPIGTFQGIEFYNDSQSSTPDSTIAAIHAFGDSLQTLIAGGLDNKVGFEELGAAIARSSIQNLILFPDTGKAIWEVTVRAGKEYDLDIPKALFVASMSEAVHACFAQTRQGKVCLLSPACQSYNMFANMQERGNLFKQYVAEQGAQENF